MRSEIEKIILEWDKYAIEVQAAINERDYSKFRRMFINGDRCFKKIRALIEKGENLKEIKEKVEKTVSDWTKVSEKIPEWISEMKLEFKKRKETAQRDKKLSGAYKKFTKHTGTKLRVKAR